jgi:glycosyltransferase involved in cell wall biosynthesis
VKIGILGTRGIPNHYGGFEQFTAFLAPELVKRGHEVFVYNSHRHPYQQKEWNGVQLIHCKDPEHKLGTSGQFLYDLNCNRDARKRNYDVLLHFGYSSDSIWWRRWPKDTINIVNMDGLEWKRTKYNWITRQFLIRAESLAAKHADHLIADSLAIQEYLSEKYKKPSTFIPYAATVFENPDRTFLQPFNIQPFSYSLLIARMEPENNIEMVIKGHLNAGSAFPLLIIGSTSTKHGKYLTHKYKTEKIKFLQAIYDASIINNLRYHASIYFHGHSVGGTNPALLEAMACHCRIAAHHNVFNKAVLGEDADYFSNETGVATIIKATANTALTDQKKSANAEKIRSIYNCKRIVDAYEAVITGVAGRR